ncbi:MAG: ATP-binding protein [Candidatus Moraniibacteriota bacterium]
MIHSFSCKNFYSISEKTVVDFTVNDKAPKDNGYFTAPSGIHLSKVETVIGPNASGKTNLLKALPFLKWLILDSFSVDPSAQLPIKPFLFGSKKDEPSELSTDFEINGNIYTYSFILNLTKILKEELRVKNKTKQKTTSKMVFIRQWNEKDNEYSFEGKGFNLPKELLRRTNSSIISSAIRLGNEEAFEIADFWRKIETNVTELGWVGGHLFMPLGQHLFDALNFYSENAKLKKEAEKLLSRFDLGLDAFDIEKISQENGAVSINAKVAHMFKGQKQYLPIEYESSGTRQLFMLLKTILRVLATGGVAVLDEFDVNLHPDMAVALLDFFVQPETNIKNAQLLFSTHSHIVLSKLDKYQIILTEKNESGETESWRLDEVTGVRADDNYYTKYIAGAYGAVPKL